MRDLERPASVAYRNGTLPLAEDRWIRKLRYWIVGCGIVGLLGKLLSIIGSNKL